eukprot:14388247-Alexandrium_andersonii.AAC.1
MQDPIPPNSCHSHFVAELAVERPDDPRSFARPGHAAYPCFVDGRGFDGPRGLELVGCKPGCRGIGIWWTATSASSWGSP